MRKEAHPGLLLCFIESADTCELMGAAVMSVVNNQNSNPWSGAHARSCLAASNAALSSSLTLCAVHQGLRFQVRVKRRKE